ncbi:hypothetical protein J2Y45_003307 [Dyadobacter sp. BE34]|uniref:Uncharacterized protein n=1 Tax=Dyadobacter fermentans TaxID=94254 RepID=A0ABU1QYA9_9BACT|nr:hypothetical protein [Dyadobacter fermentans]MDR7043856.1 hypothetical protein [Dyadobacter sp. BE242]MDR7198167.1 hypothetical protein [Dyadobacter sp. BE34]MDR7216130.1 hypothetical protein [Dyadobacter sp. BE31]MDR7264344.1 hypothetical protein [Dyadobacter sp. BE32]
MEEREDGGKGEKTINDSMTKSSSILHPPFLPFLPFFHFLLDRNSGHIFEARY